MNLANKTILFLGDSITEGHGTSSPEKCFPSLIAKETGAHCVNYGIGGTRIARQTKPSENPIWDQDFCSRVAGMQKDADFVVVFGGTNDFGHGDAPLGKMDDRTENTFYGALHVLCTSLIEKYPEAIIVFMTPLHRANEDSAFGTLKMYVDAIRQVAEYYSLPVLDLYANSGLQPNLPTIQEKYMPDQLHINDAGHAVVARKLISFLQNC